MKHVFACLFYTLAWCVCAQDLQWSNVLSGQGEETVCGAASNANGQLAVCGQFQTTMALGGIQLTNSTGDYNGFVFVFNSSGAVQWHKQFTGQNVECAGPAIDAVGNVYVLVNRRSGSTFSFNGGTAGNLTWSYPAAFIKFDGAGNLVQFTQMNSGGMTNAQGAQDYHNLKMEVTPTGEIYALGHCWALGPELFTLTGGGTTITVPQPLDLTPPAPFLLKIASNGTPLWAKAWTSERTAFMDMGIDETGNAYVVGSTSYPQFDYDPSPSMVANLDIGYGADAFILKFNPAGGMEWVKQLDANSSTATADGIVCAQGNLYLTGNYRGTVDFDPGSATHPLTSETYMSAFILALSTEGAFTWVRQLSGTVSEQGRTIDVGADGAIYCEGQFSGTLQYEGLPALSAASVSDRFYMRIEPSSELKWLTRLPFNNTRGYQYIVSGGSPFVYVIPVVTEAADIDFGLAEQLVAPVSGAAVYAIIQYGTTAIVGCTDPGAMNHEPTVVVDNGLCAYAGCTDPEAINYVPTANWNDGSCLYLNPACRSDLNADGVVNVIDFGIFVSEFNGTCP